MIEIFISALRLAVYTAMMKKHGVAQQCTSIIFNLSSFIYSFSYLFYLFLIMYKNKQW